MSIRILALPSKIERVLLLLSLLKKKLKGKKSVVKAGEYFK